MDKTILARATSSEDTPTPGYLYGEIARMTQHSYETCVKVEEYLIGRLKKKSPNTKYKALLVIKHICREGRNDFKRDMQKYVSVIKEYLQFRGPPDPLKGDEYFRRVRDTAKDCLDAIYDTDTPQQNLSAISNRICGVGADSMNWVPPGQSNFSNARPAPYSDAPYDSNSYSAPLAPSMGANGPPNNNMQPPMGMVPSYEPSYRAPDLYGGYPDQQQQQGFSTQSSVPSYGYPTQTQGRMAGIGNPLYPDPSTDQSKGFLAGLKEKAVSTFKGSTDNKPPVTFAGPPPGSQNPPEGWSFATNRGPTGGQYANSVGYNASISQSSYNASSTGAYGAPTAEVGGYGAGGTVPGSNRWGPSQSGAKLKEKAYDGVRKKGMVGGAWGAQPSELGGMQVGGGFEERRSPGRPDYASNSAYTGMGGYNNDQRRESASSVASYGSNSNSTSATIGGPGPMQSTTVGNTRGAISDGSYERNLLMGLCAPGGMRAAPAKEKLDAFLKASVTLPVDIVAPILEELLENETWQVVSKALTVIDSLLSIPGNEDGYTEYFIENSEVLEECRQNPKAVIRDRATKILVKLGLDNKSGNGLNHKQSQNESSTLVDVPSAATTTNDLLLGLYSPKNSNTTAKKSANALFDGLTIGGDNNNAPNPSPSTNDNEISQAEDMFGGLQLQVPGAPTNMLQGQMQQQQQQQQPNLMYGNVKSPLPIQSPGPINSQLLPSQSPGTQMLSSSVSQLPQPSVLPQSQGSFNGRSFSLSGPMVPGYITKTIVDPEDPNNPRKINDTKSDSFSFIKDSMNIEKK